MSSIQETLFDLLVNTVLQIGFFAIVAALFSRFVAKARAKHQYSFYLAVLIFCLAVPCINTFWHSSPTASADKYEPILSQAGGVTPRFWILQGHSPNPKQFVIPPGFQSWILATWGALVLLRLGRFSLAVGRVRRLRRNASVLSFDDGGIASRIFGADHRIALLESRAIDDPVTIGVFHPAILLPGKVLPEFGEEDLLVILAHEYSHIRRKDFLAHILCELASLPFAWHPGTRYLMSKISQAREFACDDDAVARLGKRRSYAHTLLRLASLCLHGPRNKAVALGIFDGDNLETRIMMLTKKTLLLSRNGVIGLALATGITFGAGAALAHAMSLQPNARTSNMADKFAGTWHWMFNGKSFATMILARSGSGFTGSATQSRITLNDDGGLLRADPSEDSAPKRITKARLEGSSLHITVADGFEFTVTLVDDTHAEIRPVAAPPKMKPIQAERVR